MDEVSFIELELFELVKAVLNVNGSWGFLASSPPKKKDHWFTILRESKSDIYRDYPLEKVCKKCQLEKEMAEWQDCTHQTIKSGLNKSTKKRKAMSQLNTDKEADARENLGVVVEEDSSAFEERHVKRFFEEKEMVYDISDIIRLLLAIDPNAGGSDDTGVCLMGLNSKGVHVVLWVDFLNTKKAPDFSRFIMSTIYAVSKIFREDKGIILTVAMESNSRYDGDNLRVALEKETNREFSNIHVIRDEQHGKGDGKAGVRLDGPRKSQMTTTFALLLEANLVKLYYKLGTKHHKGIKFVLEELTRQLLRFRSFDEHASLKTHGNKYQKKNNTAKDGKLTDDLVRAVIMSLFWLHRFYEKPIYKKQRIEANIMDIIEDVPYEDE